MPLFLLLLLVAVMLYLWLSRCGTTLSRACRWRLDRSGGPEHHRCAACGAETDGRPRRCLRAQAPGLTGPAGAAKDGGTEERR